MIAPPDYPSLELVIALTYLADHTDRVRFGPMISPLSFRDPVMLARQAAVLDDLSGGRSSATSWGTFPTEISMISMMWLAPDDIEGLEVLAAEVLPHVMTSA